MLDNWKQQRVRAVGRGESYIRFTPFFGFRLQVFGRVFAYNTREGWMRDPRRRKK